MRDQGPVVGYFEICVGINLIAGVCVSILLEFNFNQKWQLSHLLPFVICFQFNNKIIIAFSNRSNWQPIKTSSGS